MPVDMPTVQQLEAIAAAHHFTMTPLEIDAYMASISESLPAFERLDAMVEPKPAVRYAREPGRAPTPDENPFGGWAWKATVKGARNGLLAGKRVAIKDVIAVAGMPMRNGSSVMDGFTPEFDATVVSRILDAGGEIAGKATCESFSFSGGSNTSEPAPVRNPRNPAFMAGGSSSGSAALLAAGACDLAIGGDQGGSIRIPSAWCGVIGLKPTFGLVPFTGAGIAEVSIDTIGPMGTSAADVAILLDVIAGPDGLDPRQGRVPKSPPSTRARLNAGSHGLRIGVVDEGFAWPHSEPAVDAAVRKAAARFAELGANVSTISIPIHRDGASIFGGIVMEGTWSAMIRDEGVGRGWIGHYDTNLLDFFASARRERANAFPHTLKVGILMGAYLTERYHGHYYARAQNLRRLLTEAYDEALRSVDLLLMPTTPQTALAFDARRSLKEELLATENAAQNTCPFNLSGHPALSVPCGTSDGLPIGMMLVGRPFEDGLTLRAAHAYERAPSNSSQGGPIA